ncbi:MAG: CHASE2 domain-containing protein [Calothrix sp. SM1_7_51]|nr:CHASE2 domain-containing protein [Calothrix sp. SM1_7_51]
MAKLVVLKLTKGDFEQGFQVILQIGEDGATPTTEITGYLPPAPSIPIYYDAWQLAHSRLNLPRRIKAKNEQVTNASIGDRAQLLCNSLKAWLNDSNSFRAIREKIYEKLHVNDSIRVLLQAQDTKLWQLPWQLWDFFESYPLAELAVTAISYDQLPSKTTSRNKVRILAILGDSTGIDVEADRKLLSSLPDAEIVFLVEPERLQLDACLWDETGWDILFFAGHSLTEGELGRIYINHHENLTIEQLHNALKTAIQKGLKLAIFNSCDGLGLAQQLASLHIPQVIVMRSPVPDKVAQEFLKYFLQAFASGQPLYLAVREARERLQALESVYPYASWLPIIYQNLAQVPPTWQSLKCLVPKVTVPKRGFAGVFLASFAVTTMLMGFRSLGILQVLEYKAFDQMLLLRPLVKKESPDSQIVVIEINNTDYQKEQKEIQKQKQKSLLSKSLSNNSLAKLLEILEKSQPAAIGLDIYRDSRTSSIPQNLLNRYQGMQNLIGICKRPDPPYDNLGFPPPAGMQPERVGFSDVVADADGILRRQILFMTANNQESCQAEYSFSLLLALNYLSQKNFNLSLHHPDI